MRRKEFKTYTIKMEVIKTFVEQVEVEIEASSKWIAKEIALEAVGAGITKESLAWYKPNTKWDELGSNKDSNGNNTYTNYPYPTVVGLSHNSKKATHRTEPKVVHIKEQ